MKPLHNHLTFNGVVHVHVHVEAVFVIRIYFGLQMVHVALCFLNNTFHFLYIHVRTLMPTKLSVIIAVYLNNVNFDSSRINCCCNSCK